MSKNSIKRRVQDLEEERKPPVMVLLSMSAKMASVDPSKPDVDPLQDYKDLGYYYVDEEGHERIVLPLPRWVHEQKQS